MLTSSASVALMRRAWADRQMGLKGLWSLPQWALDPTGMPPQAVELRGCRAHPPAKRSPSGSWRSTTTAARSSTPRSASDSSASSTFGRIGVTAAALPVILPINYRYVDGRIVFRTAARGQPEAAACGSVVAFKVDGIDPLTHSGWSVIVTGVTFAGDRCGPARPTASGRRPTLGSLRGGPSRRAAAPGTGLRPAPRAPSPAQR